MALQWTEKKNKERERERERGKEKERKKCETKAYNEKLKLNLPVFVSERAFYKPVIMME